MEDLSQRYTLSIKEARAYFGISKSQIWRWIADGTIKAHKPNKEGKKNSKIFIIRKDMEKVIRKSEMDTPDVN